MIGELLKFSNLKCCDQYSAVNWNTASGGVACTTNCIPQAYKEMDIVKRIKYGRLWRAWHVVRKPKEGQAKTIFSKELGRDRRLRGRP